MNLSNEQINEIWNGMPGGFEGFCKQWGFQQFARAVIAAHDDNLSERFGEVLSALIGMTEATERWNDAVEKIIGRQPDSGIDVARARAVIARATK